VDSDSNTGVIHNHRVSVSVGACCA